MTGTGLFRWRQTLPPCDRQTRPYAIGANIKLDFFAPNTALKLRVLEISRTNGEPLGIAAADHR
jgi:hypothetical protein